MKKITAFLLTATLLLATTACGDNGSRETSVNTRERSGGQADSAGSESVPSNLIDYDEVLGDILGDVLGENNADDEKKYPFSQSIDVTAFDASLFDGKIQFDDGADLALTAPLTYEKFMEAGYTISESYLEEAQKIAEKGGSLLFLTHPDAKYEIRVSIINNSDEEMTVLEVFKAGGVSFYFTYQMAQWYILLPMLANYDNDFNPFAHGIEGNIFTYEQFNEYVFGKIGVPSAVVPETFNQWANFLYIYDYGDYSITIGVRENPDNGTLSWGTFGYDQ
ncbi:MAG: hypothetical protein FWG70_07470 [Oscillospiraceae bacterium]|nr:hypothetical protein [Oscillospiraceae bacterium]